MYPYRGKMASLVEAILITGRFHQIRRHFAMEGHPVLGDPEAGTENRAPRLLLHAWRLEFLHPKNGKLVRLQCPPPREFKF